MNIIINKFIINKPSLLLIVNDCQIDKDSGTGTSRPAAYTSLAGVTTASFSTRAWESSKSPGYIWTGKRCE